MFGGAIGLLLPLLLRTGSRQSRSTVRSRQDVIDDRIGDRPPPTLADPPGYDGKQSNHRASDDRRL